jgi:hypothetical protein
MAVDTRVSSQSIAHTPPVKGFMVVDTAFVGIGIDSDVAQELDLQPFV